ncbi:MAG: type IX secretion system outer membrane channel protein PorV [Bacteroidaceae bacterium]|nr:type IX secretion system outer membrane channel protein PorV [Bacteroidaceae bacterium]
MKKISIIVLALFAIVQHSWAQKEQFNPVQAGVSSLSIAPDSRGGGMGDVGVATDADVYSQHWNPAKYPFNISRAGIGLSYTPWLRQLVSDIDLAYLSGFYRIGDYSALSGSLRYFSLGEVPLDYDEQGEAIDAINPYEMAVDVAYSRMLSETFSAAVALRFIYSDMSTHREDGSAPGSAFAADIAFYYNNYIMLGNRECMLGLGLNASNIGSKISYDEGSTSVFIPTNLGIGASLLVPIDEYNTISFNADANKLMVPTVPMQGEDEDDAEYQDRLQKEYYDQSPITGIFKSFHDAPGGFEEELREIQWSVGMEYMYNNQFAVRAGYHHEDPYKGNRKYWTVGAGFKMSVFSLDASYVISVAQSNPLDKTLRFSLAFDLDGIRDILGR